MTPKIKQRIEQLCRSEIPEGYKKQKQAFSLLIGMCTCLENASAV